MLSNPSSQSGFISLLFVALLALGLSLTVGAVVAQLKQGGGLNRSMAQGSSVTQQQQLVAAQQKLTAWYQNPVNAWQLDSQTAIMPAQLAQILVQAGVTLDGAQSAVSTLVQGSGQVAYHVFALWYGAGVLNATTGSFTPGTANTPYVLVSGQTIEAEFVQQTQTHMNTIAALLNNYFTVQNDNDADHDAGVNWFCDPAAAANFPQQVLPCYGTGSAGDSPTTLITNSVPITATYIPQMVGLSNADIVTAWPVPQSYITVNSWPINPQSPYKVLALPPYPVLLNTVLPWGANLTMYAISS
jgi:hypothetical protein